MRKLIEWGGVIAGIVLVAFGVGALWLGISGYTTVRDDLARENITFTPDTAKAGERVDTGAEAREFAAVMRQHTMEATSNQTYSEMGRFLDAQGNATSDEAQAALGPNGRPVENPLRNMWVTETALTTALNMAYFGEKVAIFGIVVGIAFVLTGIGFLVLAFGGLLAKARMAVPGKGHAPASVAPAAGD